MTAREDRGPDRDAAPEAADDRDQGRLQEFGADPGPAPIDDDPRCERCGGPVEDADGRWPPRSKLEAETGVDDLGRHPADRDVCPDCRDLERYLRARHEQLTARPDVDGAVAVHCLCQDSHEVDVQPVRRGRRERDWSCSRCGRADVVVEELPPSAPALENGGGAQ